MDDLTPKRPCCGLKSRWLSEGRGKATVIPCCLRFHRRFYPVSNSGSEKNVQKPIFLIEHNDILFDILSFVGVCESSPVHEGEKVSDVDWKALKAEERSCSIALFSVKLYSYLYSYSCLDFTADGSLGSESKMT